MRKRRTAFATLHHPARCPRLEAGKGLLGLPHVPHFLGSMPLVCLDVLLHTRHVKSSLDGNSFQNSCYESNQSRVVTIYITLFRFIIMFCRTDNILWNILAFKLNVRNVL